MAKNTLTSMASHGIRTIGSLFSGIGGLELGLERALGARTVWQVEKDPFCRKVLAKHWTDVERHEDVCNVGAHNLAPVDLICGGFPCQDVSSAGKGAGLAGARSGLWYEFARVVGELRPALAVVENVTSGAVRWVDEIRGDLERLGYESLPVPLGAIDVGAPHRRARVFVIAITHAHSQQLRLQSRGSHGPDWQSKVVAIRNGEEGPTVLGNADRDGWAGHPSPWTAPPEFRGMDDGVSLRLDEARLRALGNAVVPQCAEVIGHVIALLVS